MPFETIVSKILTSILGDYLEGLEPEHLKISLLSGNVVHENLQLKRSAFDGLALPVQVKAGFLGKLTLTIPWTNITTQPTVIVLDRIYVIAGPTPQSQYDPKVDEKKALNTKLRRLEVAELIRDREQEKKEKNKEEKLSMASQILHNLQIYVNQLHIRYEDNISNPRNPFVFGVTLESLFAQSTNEKWQPALTTSPRIAFRLVDLKNFAVYWNSGYGFLKYQSTKEMEMLLQALIGKQTDTTDTSCHYLIRPISGRVKLALNLADTPSMPVTTANFEFDAIALTLEENQYVDLISTIQASVNYVRGMPYRRFNRPTVRPKEQKNGPKLWWRYAYTCVAADLAEKRKRWTWAYIHKRRLDRLAYMNLFVNVKSLSAEHKAALDALEVRLDYEDILLFRQLAHAFKHLRKEEQLAIQLKEKEKAKETSFFSKMFTDEQKKGVSLTPQDWRRMYDMIGFTTSNEGSNSTPAKEYVKTRLGILMKKGTLELLGSQLNPDAIQRGKIAQFNFNDLRIDVDQRDAKKLNALVRGLVGGAELWDYYTYLNKPLKLMSASRVGSPKLSEFAIELSPLDRALDITVNVIFEPINFVFARPLLDRISNFFTGYFASSIGDVSLQQDLTAVSLDESSKRQMLLKLKNHIDPSDPFKADIRVDLERPTIIIPENFDESESPALFLLPSHLTVGTDWSALPDAAVSQLEDFEEQCYRKMLIKISNLAVTMTRGCELAAVRDRLGKTAGLEPLNEHPVTIALQLGIRSAPVQSLALVRLRGEIPMVDLQLSLQHLKSILLVLDEVTDAKPRAAASQRAMMESLWLARRRAIRLNEKIASVNLTVSARATLYLPTPERKSLLTVELLDALITADKFDNLLRATLQAGSLQAFDKLHQLPDASPLRKLLSSTSPAGRRDLYLNYLAIPRDAPAYANIDRELEISIVNAAGSLHFDTWLYLFDTMLSFVDALDIKDLAATLDQLENLLDAKPAADTAVADPMIVRMRVTLQEARLDLPAAGGVAKFATVVATGVDVFLTRCVSKAMVAQVSLVNARLQSFVPLPEPIDIISSHEGADRAILLKFETFPRKSSSGFDELFEADLSTVHVMVATQFLLQLPPLLERTAASARAILSTRPPEAPKLLGLGIKLSNSYIVLPRDLSAPRDALLILKVDKLSVANRLSPPSLGPDPNPLTESIAIGINAFNIAIKPSPASDALQILKMNQLLVNIERCPKPTPLVPAARLVFEFEELPVAISEQQIAFLLDLADSQRALLQSIQLTPAPPPRTDASASVPSPVAVSERFCELDLAVQARRVVVDVLQGSSASEMPTHVLSFEATHLSASVQFFSDQTRFVTLVMHRATVLDTRHDSDNVFKQLAVCNAADAESQLVVKLQDSPVVTSVTVLISKTLFHLPVSVVSAVRSFVSPIVDRRPPAPALASVSLSPSTSPPAKALQISGQLSAVYVCVPLNAKSATSTALVAGLAGAELALEQEANTEGRMRALFRDLTIYRTQLPYLENDPNAITLLQPFNIEAKAITTPKQGDHINVEILRPRLLVSYRDAEFLVALSVLWTTALGLRSETEAPVMRRLGGYVLFSDRSRIRQDTADTRQRVTILHGLIADSSKAAANEALIRQIALECEALLPKLIVAIEQREACTSADELAALLQLNSDLNDVISRLPSPSSQAITRSATPGFKQQLIVTCESFQATLFADMHDEKLASRPFARFLLSDLELIVSNWSALLKASSNFYVQADYFNERVDYWEPFLERIHLIVDATQQPPSPADPNKRPMRVKLEVAETLNLNVTHALVQSLLSFSLSIQERSVSHLSSSLQDGISAAKNRPPVSPFLISNKSGLALIYAISNDKLKGQKVPLGAQEEKALELPFIDTKLGRQLDLLHEGAKNCHLSLQIGNSAPIDRLPIDMLGSRVLELSDHPSKDIFAVYTVSYRAGSKVITISSNFFFLNQTSLPFDVLLGTPESGTTMNAIDCGDRLSLPLPLGWMNAPLRFRPTGFDYDWSAQLLKITGVTEGKGVLTCRSRNPEVSPFFVALEVVKERIEARGSAATPHRIVVSLHPPFTLVNALPVPLVYKIINEKRELLTSGTVDRGSDSPVFLVDPSARLYITVTLLAEGITTKFCEPVMIRSQSAVDSLFVRDERDVPLDIKLETHVERSGMRKLDFYVPFWYVNMTGMRLLYRKSASQPEFLWGQARLLAQEEVDRTRALLAGSKPSQRWYRFEDPLLSRPLLQSSGTPTIQIGLSEVSEELKLAHKTQEVGRLEVKSATGSNGSLTYCVGVAINKAPGRFWRTSIATFAPAYVLVNKTGLPLAVIQSPSNLAKDPQFLEVDEEIPFHWPDGSVPKANRTLRVAFNQVNCNWSSGFRIDSIASFDVKVWRSREERVLVRVEIELRGVSSYVTFAVEREFPKYRIENRTSYSLYLQQRGENTVEIVPSQSVWDYAWDRLSSDSPNKLVLQAQTTRNNTPVVLHQGEYELDALRAYPAWRTPDGRAVSVQVKAAGPTKVLELKESAKNDVDSAQPSTNVQLLEVSLFVLGIGISIIDERPQELMYISLERLHGTFSDETEQQSLEFRIGRLQADNQLLDTPHSIVIYNPNLQRQQTFLHLTCIRSKEYQTITFVRYLAFALQEMDVRVDEVFLLRMLQFAQLLDQHSQQRSHKHDAHALEIFAVNSAGGRKSSAANLNSPANSASNVLSSSSSVSLAQPRVIGLRETRKSMIYFELFHFNPIKVLFSYMATPGLRTSELTNVSEGGMVQWAIANLGLLANMELVPLTMNALVLTHVFASQKALIDLVAGHYKRQAMGQLYKIIGSAEFIGSPVGLVTNLGTGVFDFFYEPAQGIVKSPQDFGKGLATGTLSLVTNTVYGLFNTASKITGTITKVAEAASFDESWQRERELDRVRNRPTHVGTGVLQGMKGLGMGLFQGLTGVVEKPIEGMQKEGGLGLVKGIGIGVTGIVLKPVVGVVDLVSKTTEGIRNTTTYFDERTRRRVRPPRRIDDDGILRRFALDAALGSYLVKTILDGRFRGERWLCSHFTVSKMLLVLTNGALFMVNTQAPDEPQMLWRERLTRVKLIKRIDKGIVIGLQGAPDPSDSNPATSQRVIECESDQTATVIARSVTEQILLLQAQMSPTKLPPG